MQSLTLVAVIILFVLSILWGIFSGITLGKDQANYQNVENLNQALHYFNSDQDRYPTADEFYTQKLLTPFYMSAMPSPPNINGACKNYSQYYYSQSLPSDFSLQFCLNSGTHGLSSGVHILTVQGVK